MFAIGRKGCLVVYQIFEIIAAVMCIVEQKQVPNHSNSTDVTVYLRKPNELGPSAWRTGITCLQSFSQMFFTQRDPMARSPNIIVTHLRNLSMPADQIQRDYLKQLNEALLTTEFVKTKFYQIRVVNNARVYVDTKQDSLNVLSADYYVIVIDDVEELHLLLQNYLQVMPSWNPGGKFLICYNNPLIRNNATAVALKIFDYMLNTAFVIQAVVMFAVSSQEYSLIALRYYTEINCRDLRALQFGSCRHGRVFPSAVAMHVILHKYFEKVNAMNCRFKMCASIAQPFVEANCQDGIELKFLKFFENRLKFSIDMNCSREPRGVYTRDGKWTGLLGKVQNRLCDFIIGGFYQDNELIGNFWTTDGYLQNRYTWFVKVAKRLPAWLALYSIFDNTTWLCFVLTLIISWVFWYFLVNILPESHNLREFSLAGLNNLGMSIGAAVLQIPVCISSRILYIILALYGLNISALFTTNLINVFTNPGYMKQISTLQEAIAAGIPFGGAEEQRDWFENDDDLWIYERYNYTDEFIPNSQNLKAVRKGQRILLSSRMYIAQHPIADKLFAFPNNVFTSSLQMVLKPGSPLLYKFNWLIRCMRDHGFFSKINADLLYLYTYINRIKKNRPRIAEHVVILTLEHLEGPFSLLALGISIACLLFLGELLVHRIRVSRSQANGMRSSGICGFASFTDACRAFGIFRANNVN